MTISSECPLFLWRTIFDSMLADIRSFLSAIEAKRCKTSIFHVAISSITLSLYLSPSFPLYEEIGSILHFIRLDLVAIVKTPLQSKVRIDSHLKGSKEPLLLMSSKSMSGNRSGVFGCLMCRCRCGGLAPSLFTAFRLSERDILSCRQGSLMCVI
jgi:hypothetical protein